MKTQIAILLVGSFAFQLLAESRAPESAATAKVRGEPLFQTPLEWIGSQPPGESNSAALLDAISVFKASGSKVGMAALESFLRDHPQSAWAPSLHIQMAEYYRDHGNYSPALAHWESAWAAAKTGTTATSKTFAARTLAGWTRLLASLGEKQRIDALLKEADDLRLEFGNYAAVVQGTREGLATMKMNPERSYRCGSFALASMLGALTPGAEAIRLIREASSPDGGFCLAALEQLASSNGFQVAAVKRLSATNLVVPSVVHWKLNHYAAIVEKKDHRYKVLDPTFGRPQWMDADTINAEASGYFLLGSTNLPPDWRGATSSELAVIRGKGFPNTANDSEDGPDDDGPDPDCEPPDSGDGSEGEDGPPCPEGGMPVWEVSEPYITLWLKDKPLFYRPSVGRPIELRVTYKHRAEPKGNTICGFGEKWEFNWLGYLEQDDASPDQMIRVSSGGGQSYISMDSLPTYRTGHTLKQCDNYPGSPYCVKSPYGGANIYGEEVAFIAGKTRYHRTRQINKYEQVYARYIFQTYSNVVSFKRLVAMVDKDGRTNTLYYNNTNFPNLITQVSDPYGRSAYFTYNAAGLLTNITDMAGMASSFLYDNEGNITNLHTPYGNTAFRFFSGTNAMCAFNRAIEITEPTNVKQLYAYRDYTTSFGSYHTPDPYYVYRNSFHWNRQQYAALSAEAKTNVLDMPAGDYKKATLKHWLHGSLGESSTVCDTLAAQAGPVVDPETDHRVNCMYYTYYGQDYPYLVGTMKKIVDIHWKHGKDRREIPRNSIGRPTEIVYWRDGAPVSFTNFFDGSGGILQKIWGPNGEQKRGYGYHPVLTNLLTSVTNALAYVLRYTHDTNTLRVTSVTLPGGMVTTNLYYTNGDSAGFLQSRIDIGFRTNSFAYLYGNVVRKTNELGLVTTNTWDNLSRLTSITYPDGTTISNVYDKLDLVAVKDRLNHWTYFGFNPLRQMTARTNANGQVTQYDYCDCGSLSQITRWNGGAPLATRFYHDLAGRVTNTIYPDGYSVTNIYGVNTDSHNVDEIMEMHDSAGSKRYVNHTDYGQILDIASFRLSGSSSIYRFRWTYDEYGRKTSFTDRNNVKTLYDYDLLDRLVSREIDGGGTESFNYSALGLTHYEDPLGKDTWLNHDMAGRLRYQTNANQEILQFTYNAADELLTLTDGKNQVTRWNYDVFGRVTNKVDAASNEIFRYQYDPDNRLTNRWTAAKGDTAYRYDPIGNITNVDYPGAVMDIVLKYDGVNRLTNIVDAVGGTTFDYTTAGELLSEDGPWASDKITYSNNQRRLVAASLEQPNASPWTQAYGYDEYWRLTNVVSAAGDIGYAYNNGWYGEVPTDLLAETRLPGNNVIYHTHDLPGRLISTVLKDAGNNVLNSHAYGYNVANQRTNQTFTDGNYVDYTYDDLGQLRTATGWEADETTLRLQEQLAYGYDAAWNLSRRTNNALVQDFNVNNRNELTTVTRTGTLTVAGRTTGPATGVTVNGNSADLYTDNTFAKEGITLVNGNNTFTAVATDSASRQDTHEITVNLPATNAFSYDLNGNLTNDGLRTLEYDFENQLTNVYVAGSWRSEFQYDGFGRRRLLKEYNWNGSSWQPVSEVRYVYDGKLVLQKRNANNVATVSYTRGLDLSGTLDGAGGIGGLLARTDNVKLITGASDAHAFYHADGNGNITALIHTNGLAVARYSYDPYGNMLAMSGPLAEVNLYRFSSKEYHANSGLYYYGFRFYSPNLQRWVNRDPIEELGGINMFQFAFNNAIKLVDLFGFCAVVFDGSNLSLYGDKAELLGTYPATSGLNGSKDPTKKNEGPIPPGNYMLNPEEISESGPLRPLTGDWGDYRAPLHPVPETETFGRDGFFLHGGEKPGSLGCIDVGSADKEIFEELKKSKDPIDVVVTYPPPPPVFVLPVFPPECSTCDKNVPK